LSQKSDTPTGVVDLSRMFYLEMCFVTNLILLDCFLASQIDFIGKSSLLKYFLDKSSLLSR
jgi:hypothetical protein